MCNELPPVSEDMKRAVNAVYGDQQRTRGEIRSLAKGLGADKGPTLKASTRALLDGFRSGTSPS